MPDTKTPTDDTMTSGEDSGLRPTARNRITAATRELVKMAGGLEAAASVCSYGKSTVQRWASHDHGDLIPICAAMLLEEFTGQPVVTRAMAAVHDLTLCPTGEVPSFATSFAAVSGAVSDLTAKAAHAMADGVICPTESRALARQVNAARGALDDLENSLAATHTQAGGAFPAVVKEAG
ncbi:MAG: phage regulatory CII family protein [Pseudomonadota bacterium]